MHELRYKLWGEPTGEGSNDQYAIYVSALAKWSRKNPFELANEMLCLRLGTILQLPVPMGFITSHEGRDYYVSLESAIRGEKLPPATDEELKLIADDLKIACGILMFDAWILNEDRGPSNIAYDEETKSPLIFDHGSAFYDTKHGAKYFDDVANSLCLEGHCLAPLVTSLQWFDDWYRKFKIIPEGYIEESVKRSVELGIPAEDERRCSDFLLDRRERLDEIFLNGLSSTFTNLNHDMFHPLGTPPIYNYYI